MSNTDSSSIIDPISFLSEDNELAVFNLQGGGRSTSDSEFSGGTGLGFTDHLMPLVVVLCCTVCITCTVLIFIINGKSNCK